MIRVIYGTDQVTFIPATLETARLPGVRCLLGPGPYGSYESGDTTDFIIAECGRLAAEFDFEVVFEFDQRQKASGIMLNDLIAAEVAGLFDRSEDVPSKGGDVTDRPIDYRSKYE
jgi:hypothetical protein